MGSDSDLPIMQAAAEVLTEMGIPFELTVVSAHRTPQRMMNYATSAAHRGLKVIIAGAGGAAHLPGMVASVTTLPVIGVPIKSSNSIDGWDSVLSILQMPNGVPVATVALNAAKNAGLLAAQIIGAFDANIALKMDHPRTRAWSTRRRCASSPGWTSGARATPPRRPLPGPWRWATRTARARCCCHARTCRTRPSRAWTTSPKAPMCWPSPARWGSRRRRRPSSSPPAPRCSWRCTRRPSWRS